MNLFRRITDADPRVVTLLPYRDPRTQRMIDKLLEREYDRRTVQRRQAKADRRRSQAVDKIALEYAEVLAPRILALQAD
jgi:hypothetical protein